MPDFFPHSTMLLCLSLTLLLCDLPLSFFPYVCYFFSFCSPSSVFLFFFYFPLIISPFSFLQKDEPGRGRTCNLQIRSLTRFHCATGPSYLFSFSLFCFLLTPPPHLDFFDFSFGRFISSRIHPFPSEHGSKDA